MLLLFDRDISARRHRRAITADECGRRQLLRRFDEPVRFDRNLGTYGPAGLRLASEFAFNRGFLTLTRRQATQQVAFDVRSTHLTLAM